MRRIAIVWIFPLLITPGCSPHPLAQRAQALVEPAQVAVSQENHSWVLRVDGDPFFVKGVYYQPTQVGGSPEPDMEAWMDWAHLDKNENGRADAPYDAFVDSNFNNQFDAGEERVGDFALMQAMGVNTLLWYHNTYDGWLPHKDVLRTLVLNYGIRVAVGDLFGAYPQSQGYEWKPGTDYTHPHQRKVLLESVRKMVLAHKDEPYVLVWLLGYDNNWAHSGTNAVLEPQAYAGLLNEAAQLIHELDGAHPVAVVNADLGLLEYYAEYAPAIDILGVNSQRGTEGFSELWSVVDSVLNRPVLITAYGGVDAPGYLPEEQMWFHRERWLELSEHRAGQGYGNAIGGVAMEWVDQWWRAGRPHHQAGPDGVGEFRGHTVIPAAEWAGIWSQGNGDKSPFVRQPRLVYCMYQVLWNENLNAWLPWCDTREELDAMAVRFMRERDSGSGPDVADEMKSNE